MNTFYSSMLDKRVKVTHVERYIKMSVSLTSACSEFEHKDYPTLRDGPNTPTNGCKKAVDTDSSIESSVPVSACGITFGTPHSSNGIDLSRMQSCCDTPKPPEEQTPKILPSFATILITSTPSNAQQIQKEMRRWKLDDFKVHNDCLGRGQFGSVYLAMEKSTKFYVALKILSKEQLGKKMHNQLKREVEIQSRLRHPNILKLFAYFQDDPRIYLVLEYASGGTLFQLLRRANSFIESKAAGYTAQVANALKYCHSKSIIHRDIKPENILIHKNGTLKVADFGWSVQQEFNSNRTTLCGAYDYMAPEMFDKKYDEKVDVWSLGILAYEMITGVLPFKVKDYQDKYLLRKWDGEVKFPECVNTSASKDFISKLLQREPIKRLSIEDALSHSWLYKHNKDKTPRRI